MTLKAERIQEQLVQWRRTLHQYPEIAFQERETARIAISHCPVNWLPS
ncbi:MAG: hypothetical protein U1F42_08895 [Candidatus Competibacteraceae bacterium]